MALATLIDHLVGASEYSSYYSQRVRALSAYEVSISRGPTLGSFVKWLFTTMHWLAREECFCGEGAYAHGWR